MKDELPQVTIGLPVYNGENYLAEALDSILAQTFANFEIIISDNASTDQTEAISRTYQAKDKRIKYIRNEENLGAAKNYNQVVALARGEYFKWAAHDDLIAPLYLEKCVAVLDKDPSILIAHTKTSIVDEHGKRRLDFNDFLDFRSPIPHHRFRNYLFRKAAEWNAIFGLMRTKELKKTPLIGSFIASDQVVLGELVLRGKVFQIPETLFFRRDHPQNSWRSSRTRADLTAWFDPTRKNEIILPREWRHLYEYLRTIHRVRLSLSNRVWCYVYMSKWAAKRLIWWPMKRKWHGYSGRNRKRSALQTNNMP